MRFPDCACRLCPCLRSARLRGRQARLRVDSLIATQKDGVILVQAKGAVQTGGWTKPHLHVMHGDGHTVTVEFLAAPPPPGMTVIDALVPVTATAPGLVAWPPRSMCRPTIERNTSQVLP